MQSRVMKSLPGNYLPACPVLVRRDHPAGFRAADPEVPDAIPAQIDVTLRRLRGLHLTLSIYRLRGVGADDLAEILAEVDDPALLTAPQPEGGVAILYIRPDGQSDSEATDYVTEKLRQALSGRESRSSLRELQLAGVHRSADAFDDGTGLFAELDQVPPQPLWAG